jgi:hypothetical protein
MDKPVGMRNVLNKRNLVLSDFFPDAVERTIFKFWGLAKDWQGARKLLARSCDLPLNVTCNILAFRVTVLESAFFTPNSSLNDRD